MAGVRFSGVIKVSFQNGAVFCVGGVIAIFLIISKKSFLDFWIL